jgi:hypothetical protein
MVWILYLTDLIYRHGGEENLTKMMDISKIAQHTIEEQMFYHRRTLQEITELREINSDRQSSNNILTLDLI